VQRHLTQKQLNDIIKDMNSGVSHLSEEKKLETSVIKKDAEIADEDMLEYISVAVAADEKAAYR